jgi:hypothetical protein
MSGTPSCRDEIIEAIASLERRSRQRAFPLHEIVSEVIDRGSGYQPSTIRTEITSRMCAQAPKNHGVVYADLDRVDRGKYAIRRLAGHGAKGTTV